jgi:hypothetical protein
MNTDTKDCTLEASNGFMYCIGIHYRSHSCYILAKTNKSNLSTFCLFLEILCKVEFKNDSLINLCT